MQYEVYSNWTRSWGHLGLHEKQLLRNSWLQKVFYTSIGNGTQEVFLNFNCVKPTMTTCRAVMALTDLSMLIHILRTYGVATKGLSRMKQLVRMYLAWIGCSATATSWQEWKFGVSDTQAYIELCIKQVWFWNYLVQFLKTYVVITSFFTLIVFLDIVGL